MKKLLAVMLAMVMVLSLLAGCGSKSSKKNNNKDDEDDDDDKETTSDVASDATGKEEDKKPAKDEDKKPAKDEEDEEEEEDSKKDTTAQTESTRDPDSDIDPDPTDPTEEEDEITVPEPTIPEPTTPQQPNGGTVRPYPGGNDTEAGTLLSAPEKDFDLNDYNALHFSYTSKNQGMVQNESISMIRNNDDTGVIYVVSDNNIYVIEINQNGIDVYSNENTPSTITKVNISQDNVEALMDKIDTIVSIFADFEELYEGAQYRKLSSTTIPSYSGSVYIYDVIMNGQVVLQAAFDQATGFLVYMVNSANAATITVNEFKTSGVQIPNYK